MSVYGSAPTGAATPEVGPESAEGREPPTASASAVAIGPAYDADSCGGEAAITALVDAGSMAVSCNKTEPVPYNTGPVPVAPRSALVAETILYSCLPEANIKGPLHTVTFPRRETVTDPFECEIATFP